MSSLRLQQLERECLKNEIPGSCEKGYSKLASECGNGTGGRERNCQMIVETARKQLCRKKRMKRTSLCRVKRQAGYDTNPRVTQRPYHPQFTPQPPLTKEPTPPPPQPQPNPAPQPEPPAPAQQPPQPPAPTPEPEKSSLFSGSLLIGFFICGIFVCIGISAVVGYLYYTKRQEKEREEERRRMEQSRQMDKKRRKKMRKKKSKRIIVQKTGEETRVERREAKEKDREEEVQKWKDFDEANRKPNTFLDP
ncbi:hypothetical protein CAEBREN_09937 [Caenorhabditis brenneri]|uniref:Uncharacterized protein n=1 Tax=Caenorhabditis brenneri TaxID=135651 RepID=G0N5M1_CAEBE|nr:hypothetical protein CAEBREN_09937 [Caenorhabditis brenneri]